MGKLILKCGNILDYIENIDAIVNSTNKYMTCGSGVCGAIYKKANKDMLEEYCKNNFKEPMKVNEIRITKGFDLGIDIIHIYCPKYYESKDPINQLLEGYKNIFILAKDNGYKNIVSISLGTGLHGYEHQRIAKEVVNKIVEYANRYDVNLYLVLHKKEEEKYYID